MIHDVQSFSNKYLIRWDLLISETIISKADVHFNNKRIRTAIPLSEDPTLDNPEH
jgi:hypothetical protein